MESNILNNSSDSSSNDLSNSVNQRPFVPLNQINPKKNK